MVEKIPNSKTFILKNGTTIVVEEIKNLRTVSIGILVGAGNIYENKNNSGISHFIEHMIFKGTKNMSALDIVSKIDGIGGKINAYTSKEFTFFYVIVEDKHFSTAAQILSDIFLNSLFNEKDIELEKKVILEEIKLHKDSPETEIHDIFAQTALKNHPLGMPILGTEESIKNISRESIKSYLKSVYLPKNIIISVAGNIKAKNVLNFFSPIFSKKNESNKKLSSPAIEIKSNCSLKTKNTEQIHFVIGTKGPMFNDEKKYTYSILDNILGSTMSSRLFQEIREKRGLAYSIQSYLQSFRQTGLFCIYAGTKKDTFEQTLYLILEEMKKIKKDGITDEELNRAKESDKGALVLRLESSKSRMSYLATSQFYFNRIVPVDELTRKIDRIKKEDIVELANEIFIKDYICLSVIGNIKKLPMTEFKV